MKKITSKLVITYLIMSTTLSLISSCSSVEETTEPIVDRYLSIPDVHFETKLIELGIDSDGIVNQLMLKTDATRTRALDLNFDNNSGKINDLTGIEGFTNLTFLSAAMQNIKHVDLSCNTMLDTLYLTANELTTIDLSKNTRLVFIDLQSNEFNSPSSIVGLSNLIHLKDLDLSWNYLEDFSIHNESLEILHISHNDLLSINTDRATNLQHIFMPSNKLQTVDFTTNTSLETLLLAGNKIEHINLQNNTGLTHLYISSNSLMHLDVSKNVALIDLRVDRNPELTCIKIDNSQTPYVMKSDYQELNPTCN